MSDQTKEFEGLSGRTTVLGLQHMFVMFGATVLVPLITGLDVGVTLFAAGIGTWLFHILTKFKVPVFLGSSFAFVPPIMAVAGQDGFSLAHATGGLIVAGGVYIVIAIIFTFVSYNVLRKILPPHVTGPIIVLIGLILAPVAIGNITNVTGDNDAAQAVVDQIGKNGAWLVAGFTFAVGVVVKVGFERIGWKFLSTLPVLLALILGYILSAIVGIVDFSAIGEANWVGPPDFMLPKFAGGALALIVPVAIVTAVEHFGDIIAVGNVVKKDFLKDPGINRTLLGDGLATSLSGFLGGPANTTYSENTGALALTGVFNPLVMRIAAVFAIILSFVPKFTAVIQSIPAAVIGGISILLFGMIASIGIRNMIDARINFDDSRVLIIASAMLVLGIGDATWNITETVSLSGLGLAAIVGILLNVLINFRSFKEPPPKSPAEIAGEKAEAQ
ncbi:MAG: uracil-xanthine permease family protein [Spirochaetaceae bacterium]